MFPQTFSKILTRAILFGACVFVVSSTSAVAQEPTPTEADYYKLEAIEIPKWVHLEAGGIEELPDGKLAVSTRRGDIFVVEGAAGDIKNLKFTQFAQGLHEVLGLAYRDGWLYATQRCEVSRMKDENGDGRADVFETVSDFWGINGDYHEYAFGSKFDKNGHLWVVLCLTGSGGAADNSPFRGWCVRVTADGKTIPTCSGIRSPGGIGMNAAGDMFYSDNQGPWNGTSGVKHLKPGGFMGNPTGNKYFNLTDVIGPQPKTPKSGSRIHIEEKNVPDLVPTAIFMPHGKMGQSTSGIMADTSGGKFGPFAGQTFVGDQTFSNVARLFFEKIDGVYQGACFHFRSGIGSGTLSLKMTKAGQLFVGGTNRGWGSRGKKPYSLDRVTWTGKVPFEIHEMRVKPDGFELTFTHPVDAKTAGDVKSYAMKTWTYIYQSKYGSPEVDHTTPGIKSATVSADRRSVRLVIDKMQLGHVHELLSAGVRSEKGLPLLHKEAYYTLHRIPKK